MIAGTMEKLGSLAGGPQGRTAWLQLLQQLLQAPSLQAILLAGLHQSKADGPRSSSGSRDAAAPEAAAKGGKKAVADSMLGGTSATEMQDVAGEGAAARLASSALIPHNSHSMPAWDNFGFILNVVTNFCKADPSEIPFAAFRSHESHLASSRL